MKRVESNGQWSLFCPNEAPGLHEVWGEEFEELYEKYEKEGRARKTIEAQKLWYAILEAQIETGGPFMLYKDACNRELYFSSIAIHLFDCRFQGNQTSRILVLSSHQTFVPRLSSTRLLTRPPYATSPPSPSLPSSRTASTTSRSCMM